MLTLSPLPPPSQRQTARRPHPNPSSASLPQQKLPRRAALHLLLLSLLPLPQKALSSPAERFTVLPCPSDTQSCRHVEVHDFRVGTGREAVLGATLYFKWTGRLADRYGWPIQKEDADEVMLTLGKDALIPGFVQGVVGMREGGKRRIFVPAEFGYRDQKMGPLPAAYGDRRRLFATVLNERRFKKAGDLVIDVQLRKVKGIDVW